MSIICRACLQNVDKNSYFYIDTFDNNQIANTIPKDVLQLCVPEMDLYISEHPGVCSECLSMFESFYHFKNRCLASEEKILTYLKRNNIGPQCKVNLLSVICDVPEPALKNNEDDKNDEIKVGEDVVLINLPKGYSNGNVETLKAEGEVLLLSCNECSFITMEKRKLISHKCMSISTPDKYKCPYCDYSTSRRYRLSYHINAKHTKTNWYACNQCDYKSTDSSSLKRHQKVVHSIRQEGTPMFNCMYCDFSSVSEVALQRHRVGKHGPVIQYCSLCSYQTKDKSNFRKHLYIHGDKPRKCTKCSYQCVSPYQLEKHYKKSHV